MKFATPVLIVAVCMTTLVMGACNRTADEPVAKTSKPETPAKSAASTQITEPTPMAYEEPMVGGALMSAGNDLLANIAKSRDHTTLLKAIQASGLDEILKGAGPFTIFAPTNAAFNRMPAGTLDNLLKPENRSELISLLNYHIVPERLDDRELQSRLLAATSGSISLQTIDGVPLKATVSEGKAMVVDVQGNLAQISVANVLHSNGVMHVIDGVMMPRKSK